MRFEEVETAQRETSDDQISDGKRDLRKEIWDLIFGVPQPYRAAPFRRANKRKAILNFSFPLEVARELDS